MVSFEGQGAEVTIAQTASDLMRMMILQRRQDTINSFNHYEKERSLGVAVTIDHIKGNLTGLFLELAGSLEGETDIGGKGVTFSMLAEQIESYKYGELRAAFETINRWLYQKELTKFDNRQRLGGNIVQRNKVQGG